MTSLRKNPYPGTREFAADEKDNFFGRREEIDILAALVLARRTSLLFAQSGAGKSSLINAGLVPELTRREEIGRGRRRRPVQKMHVLPVTGVGGGIPSRLGRPLENVYVFSALHSLFPEAEPDTLAGQRLSGGIAPLVEEAGGGSEVPVLLVFDQFEELFTQHVERWRERLAFFEKLAEALEEHSGLHMLFSMREDFIAELTPFADLLPGGLRDRFRLERLRPEAALRALRRPAERAGSPFAEGVAEELVDNLRRGQAGRRRDLRVPGAESSDEPAQGEYVEPVHLQIVCWRLWENLDADRTSIEQRDLQRLGDVDQALSGFYRDGLRSVLERTPVPEHRLRGWFEDTPLITPARTRGLVYRGAEQTEGLPNAAVDELVDAYLLRAIRRGGDTWYELAHDRLVEPILADNREWRAEHLKPLTVAAEAWEEADRDPRKLYSGALLVATRARLETNPDEYSQLELEFLDASTTVEQTAVRRRRRQVLTTIGVTAGLAIAAMLSTWFWALASKAKRVAYSRELAAHSAGQLEEDPELSLLLALEAVDMLETAEATAALRQALLEPRVLEESAAKNPTGERFAEPISPEGCSVAEVKKTLRFRSAALSHGEDPYVGAGDSYGVVRIAPAARDCVENLMENPVLELRAHREQVTDVAFSKDGELVLTASDDGTAAVWAMRSGRPVARLRGHREPVLKAAFGPKSNQIRTSSRHTTRLWEIDLPRWSSSIENRANEIRISPGGRLLVARSNRLVRVLDIKSGRPMAPLDAGGKRINAVAFSPDGNWVATAGADHVVRVESLEGRRRRQLVGHDGEVTTVTFGGKLLLSTGADDKARLWDWRSEEELRSFPHEDGSEAALSPGADRIVAIGIGEPHSAEIWRLDRPEPVVLPHPDRVRGASFDSAGHRVVTACDDGTVRLWGIDGKPLNERPIGDEVLFEITDRAVLYGASFNADGSSVLIWGEASTAYLWWPEKGETLVRMSHDADSEAPLFSDNGEFVLTYGSDQAQAWDARSPYPQQVGRLVLAGPAAKVVAQAWSADGRQLAVAWRSVDSALLGTRSWIELHSCEVCLPLAELQTSAQERLNKRQPKRSLTEGEQRRYLP